MSMESEAPIAGRATNDICQRMDAQHHRVDGRELSLPMDIERCSLMMSGFTVDAKAAQRLLDGTGLTAARVLPGKSVLLLMGVDYQSNPLGNYNEAAVLISAYPPGEGKRTWMSGAFSSLRMRVPYFVYRMPVDQEFTIHAGRFLWGYPKYLAQIDIRFQDKAASTQLMQDGQLVVSFEAPATTSPDDETPQTANSRVQTGWNLTWRDGQLRRVEATMGGRGLAFRMGGKPPEIGERHPLAMELRELGLPKRPLFSASLKWAQMTFGVPELL